ncbi:NHL domain-containing thioredoxin family protein [Pengzhenrongella phosphoraccumulans]|uniref:NHL domain-containing thioredoxin family protein n=1 Tax=Pengzhenrongella phosphoraccumulans TaxID=3114394 RepID=UPI00388D8A2D
MASSLLPKVRASPLVGRGWLNTGGRDVSLADLRGKIVVLDFWTFCCINCLHVLDELRELERQYADVLVIVGVHSPKFAHEADPVALAAAVERYEVHHPVLDDPQLTTWSAYTARAWPTLVVIDPEGYIVAQMAGEGHAHNLSILIADLAREHEAKGTLHRGDGPYVAPAPSSGTLRFPAKAIALTSGTFLVADAGHHSLAELAADGETLVRRIGSGIRGLADGDPTDARFSEPNGLCEVPAQWRTALGFDVLVADTVNHALRGVRLRDGHVTTVAGTGEQYMVGGQDNGDEAAGDPLAVRLSSPWDVVWSDGARAFVVAMAGNHTLWALDPASRTIRRLAGTMNEGLQDGPVAQAWFAQTSGLAVDAGGRVWLADSEVSALRYLDFAVDADTEATRDVAADAGADAAPRGTVGTAVGAGLYDFGFRDGPADQALLQHPLGVAVLPDGSIAIADTYNGAIRRYAPGADGRPGAVTTLARDLAEPSGVVVLAPGDDGDVELVVVESAAHRLTRIRLPREVAGEILDAGAHRTQRPVTDVAPGPFRVEVVFTPAAGQKYDDRYGPSTRLQVSSTPPELLLAGAGDGVDLARDVILNPAVPDGVLHVTAHAASCDADPSIPYPACHLNTQDWGIPIRTTGTTTTLTLPLLG